MRGNTYRADELLGRLAKAYGWTDKFMEFKVKDAFKQLVEPAMLAAVARMWVKERVLYLDIPHAAAKSDMQYRLGELKEAINKMLGHPYLQALALK